VGTPASSTTETGHHDIAEILLTVELNTKNQSINLCLFVRFRLHGRCFAWLSIFGFWYLQAFLVKDHRPLIGKVFRHYSVYPLFPIAI
jgi:hypothetical protein